MRSSTLILAGLVMRHGGVRAAARAAGQPVSSASTAIARLEEALGQTLLRRTDDGLALTLEGRRCRPAIERIAAQLQAMHGCGPDQLPAQAVGLEALFRLAEALRAGSIRRAAQQLGLGQPQLTRQIAQVERSLGIQVAERGASGLALTADGVRLAATISLLEEEWLSLTASLKPTPGRSTRQFSFGSVIPASPEGDLSRMLARLGGQLHLRHGLRFSLVSTLAEDLLLGLDSGRFDCVFLDARLRERAYNQVEVMRGPVALFGHPATGTSAASLRAVLRQRPLVMQTRRSGLRQRAEAFFDRNVGADWRSAATLVEVDSLPIIVAMVREGGFLSVLPAHVAERLPDLPRLPLPPDHDQRVLLTWRKGARAEKVASLLLSELGIPRDQ